MAQTDKAIEKDWERVQVYMPPDFYEVLQARAKRRGVSLSSEAYRLIRIGLANVKPNENLESVLTDIERYLKLHLEPLAFIAAMDSAFNAANWEQQTWLVHERQNGGDKEKATETYQDHQRTLRKIATKRLQRKLRDFDRSELEDDSEGED